jgi:hypothetical protein
MATEMKNNGTMFFCRKNKLKGFGEKNKQGGLKDGERMIMKEKQKKVENKGLTWSDQGSCKFSPIVFDCSNGPAWLRVSKAEVAVD